MTLVDDTEIKWLVALLAAIAAAGALWYFWGDLHTQQPVIDEPPPAVADRNSGEPLHPIQPLDLTPGEGELVPLPSLDESDSYFALALVDLFGRDLETLLAGEGLIDKTVASVDNLTRARVAEKIRPVGRIAGNFIVESADGNGAWLLSQDNYARYDFLVNMLAGANLDEVVATYRRFYPLFQEAYLRLGYPDGYFNDRAVAVIDQLLATPQPAEPIRLVRPHVLYEFADPELEALSSGQKLLIRMGPDNAGRVKSILAELRTRIANTPD